MEIFSDVENYGQLIRLSIWLVLGFLAYIVGARLMLPTIHRLATRTPSRWDDVLIETGAVRTLGNLLTAVALNAGVSLISDIPALAFFYIVKLLNIYLILTSYLLVIRVMRAFVIAYEQSKNNKKVPLKTITQAIAVVLTILAVILVVSQLTDKSPIYLLSGLGALAAVLMLIFKDSILGLVAGVQLSVNDLVRKGDWIEMPKHGADGDVIDITLTTVRVQNWDKTITAIPAYDLVSSSFKNWRGMSESGGRRIKRSIFIDMNTIRFLSESDIENLKTIKVLRDYLTRKRTEIESFNHDRLDPSELKTVVNGRRLTNVGTFRAYCVAYLSNHPEIHSNTPGLTFIVRQLQPTPQGLPLEIYVFVKDIRWVPYEGIQADIFDHLLASLPQFGLRAYQQPSGSDIKELKEFFPGAGGSAHPSSTAQISQN